MSQFSWGATFILEGFARLAAAEGRPERALRLAGATEKLRRVLGVEIGPLGEAAFRRSLKPAWQALPEDGASAAWESGRTMTFDHPGHLPCVPRGLLQIQTTFESQLTSGVPAEIITDHVDACLSSSSGLLLRLQMGHGSDTAFSGRFQQFYLQWETEAG